MKGTIIERPKGSRNYCIRYSAGFDPITKKYRQIWESGFKSITEARKRLTELEHQRNTNSLPKPNKETVAQYLHRWLDTYAEGNLSPRTVEGYRDIIHLHLTPAFQMIQLSQLNPENIQQYYSKKLSSGLSTTTVRHHHTCLHCALKMALIWGLIVRNPADAVTAPKIHRNDMQTMTEDDLKKFLEAARSTDYYALFYCALMTGARRGELLALRWSDLDLIRAEMHINRNMVQLRDRSLFYKSTKTAKGKRTISLSPSTALILRRHKEEREAICCTLQTPFDPDSPVFCHSNGKNLLPDSVSQRWRTLLKKTGMKHFRFHDARHTMATNMLKQGIHPKIVQERLGHSTIGMTMDLYSHVTPTMQQDAAVKLDMLFKPSTLAEFVADL